MAGPVRGSLAFGSARSPGPKSRREPEPELRAPRPSDVDRGGDASAADLTRGQPDPGAERCAYIDGPAAISIIDDQDFGTDEGARGDPGPGPLRTHGDGGQEAPGALRGAGEPEGPARGHFETTKEGELPFDDGRPESEGSGSPPCLPDEQATAHPETDAITRRRERHPSPGQGTGAVDVDGALFAHDVDRIGLPRGRGEAEEGFGGPSFGPRRRAGFGGGDGTPRVGPQACAGTDS